jgi:hypothetical protein
LQTQTTQKQELQQTNLQLLSELATLRTTTRTLQQKETASVNEQLTLKENYRHVLELIVEKGLKIEDAQQEIKEGQGLILEGKVEMGKRRREIDEIRGEIEQEAARKGHLQLANKEQEGIITKLREQLRVKC